MNRNKYLDKLRSRLDALPLGELAKILQHYENYFEEVGKDREEEIMRELGTPKELAARIEQEYFQRETLFAEKEKNDKIRKKIPGMKIALLLTFYIWIPLLLFLYLLETMIVIASIVMTMFGVMCLVSGIFTLFHKVPTGVFFMGAGLIIVAAGILIFPGGIHLIRLTNRLVGKIFGKENRGESDE